MRERGVVIIKYKTENERRKTINSQVLIRSASSTSVPTSHYKEALDLLEECEINLALLEARGLISIPYNNKTRRADWTNSIGMQWTRFLKLSIEMVPMKCDKWVPDYQRLHCTTCNIFLNPFQRGLRHQ